MDQRFLHHDRGRYRAPLQLRIGWSDRSQGLGGVHNLVSPVTGEVIGAFPLAGKIEIDEAVERADAVAEEWRCWKPEARRDVLLKLQDLLRREAEEIIRLSALECGIPRHFGQVLADMVADFTGYYAGWADKLNGEQLAGYDTRGQFAYTTAQPLGVVGVILTWNGPAPSIGMKIVPALAAGNCVVVKPSEVAPLVADLFARLAREAGIPDGVLSVLPGGPEAGEALVAHPKVSKISSTGGPGTARKIMQLCASTSSPR